MRKFTFLLIFLMVSFCNGQQNSFKIDGILLKKIELLDFYLQNNDNKILDILCNDVSFGHSNGWVQNFDDFKKDFSSKKVVYKEIKQLEILEYKTRKRTASIRRILQVSGTYKDELFQIKLTLLEIWLKKNSEWKLWSRQSVENK
ncbi:nuclear transport factor 2 family protein [Frigoriflavimonas asaccharolytica]|uniref:DUF4440 domain-containing protein n=1 Tax=Frigoriflavimonas asaccharolytica TaxID=2735899 RepID=A0A8J8G4N3_9FLAO|nr:nuclear transport factor 2 family protein [Frigoriflavimonas asaccharolytica]NRS91194.1 hypothetical protein [Frigoriflavimonas asaccharolytica]